MSNIDDALRQYLKKEYPVIALALETGTVSGNELWLVDIAMRAFRQGFALGQINGVTQPAQGG